MSKFRFDITIVIAVATPAIIGTGRPTPMSRRELCHLKKK